MNKRILWLIMFIMNALFIITAIQKAQENIDKGILGLLIVIALNTLGLALMIVVEK